VKPSYVSAPDNRDVRTDYRKYIASFPVRARPYLIGALLLSGGLLCCRWLVTIDIGRRCRPIGSSVAFVGLLLTLANIAGVFLELRSTTLHAVKGAYGDGDVQLRLQDGLALLEWRPNDNATTYGVRATHAIARSVVPASSCRLLRIGY
jgi:hypothetical protein